MSKKKLFVLILLGAFWFPVIGINVVDYQRSVPEIKATTSQLKTAYSELCNRFMNKGWFLTKDEIIDGIHSDNLQVLFKGIQITRDIDKVAIHSHNDAVFILGKVINGHLYIFTLFADGNVEYEKKGFSFF